MTWREEKTRIVFQRGVESQWDDAPLVLPEDWEISAHETQLAIEGKSEADSEATLSEALPISLPTALPEVKSGKNQTEAEHIKHQAFGFSGSGFDSNAGFSESRSSDPREGATKPLRFPSPSVPYGPWARALSDVLSAPRARRRMPLCFYDRGVKNSPLGQNGIQKAPIYPPCQDKSHGLESLEESAQKQVQPRCHTSAYSDDPRDKMYYHDRAKCDAEVADIESALKVVSNPDTRKQLKYDLDLWKRGGYEACFKRVSEKERADRDACAKVCLEAIKDLMQPMLKRKV